jgi:adrenodoxin-NADP+ reductase
MEGEVPVDRLKKYYDAIIFAYGASRKRQLGIEGESLAGVSPAGDFVGWYNAVPSHRHYKFNLDAENAVVIGHGNVALDVARILLTPTPLLAKTDITNYALEMLAKSRVKNVTIVGRRGVIQAAFTVKELRELTNIPDAEFNVTLPSNLPDPKSLPRVQQRILQLLKKAPFTPAKVDKSCTVKFLLSPRRFIGNGSHVSAVEFEQQKLLDPLNPASKIEATGEIITIKTDMVFTAIGYSSISLKGMSDLGVDVVRGIIPNIAGHIITEPKDEDDGSTTGITELVPGLYVSGWVKTGPTGVIATTMYSAFETADSLVYNWQEANAAFLEPESPVKGWEGFKHEIERAGGKPILWNGWKKIEFEEERRGALVGKEREKIVDIQEMVDIVESA